MAATIALLPSPLLGPAAWEPVAQVLRAEGRAVLAVDLPTRITRPADILAAFTEALAKDDAPLLVPHSNAGLFAPAVAETVDALGTVFVDAALPPTTGATRLAPPRLLRFLDGLADEQGMLPPWTLWWEEDDVRRLFPSAWWRRRVETTQHRLPLSYFESTLSVPDGWTALPSAYLAFGETYAEETARARSHGWPTEVVAGRHLHMLNDPEAVAHSIVRLARRAGILAT